MPEFGDELVIESINVPCLMWIQLIVTILLIILLLFGFSIFTSGPTPISSVSAVPASPSAVTAAAPPSRLNKPSSSHRRIMVGEQSVRRDEETSGEVIREEEQNENYSSLKDSLFLRFFRFSNHPCNFFGKAKQALLKCFGLDSSSEPSSGHRHEKQE